VTGSGEERRRYLDYTLFTLDPSYLEIAQQYRRALRQKQALLRADLPRAAYEDQVIPWDEKLVTLGEEIRFRRRKLVRRLHPLVNEAYKKLARDSRELEIVYLESEAPLRDEILARRTTEYAAQRTLCGPQRDDLDIRFDGQPAAVVASQGEKASLLLALKLAELEILENARGERAILILDDIGVTLDRERRGRLFSLLAESPHQALVSTPEEEIADTARRAGALVLSRFAANAPGGFSVAQWGAA
jgi:DNA replication and repair protein RecF